MSRLLGLKRALPKSGMKYAKISNFLARGGRDRQVARAIMDATAASTTTTTTNTNTSSSTSTPSARLPKAVVELLLVQLFEDAADLFAAEKARGGNSSFTVEFLGLMEALQPARDWTRGLKEPIFIELFAKLSAARAAWWESPTLPYEEERHSELARSIDRFNLVAGGDKRREWAAGGLEMYELAGGLLDADDYDDDDDSNSSISSSSSEAEDQSDVEMADVDPTMEEVTAGVEEMDLA